MINPLLLVTAVSVLGFASCNGPMTGDLPPTSDPLRPGAGPDGADRAARADAFIDFSLRLFRQVQAEEGGANVFVSPASVAFALAMTHEGAASETQREMARLLGLEPADVARAAGALGRALQRRDADLRLDVANSLWAARGIPFLPHYLERTRQEFGAEVTTLDFGDPAAPDRINEWVSSHTQGRIPRLIERLRPEEVLFLVNAVYFKGQWTHRFEPRAMRPGDFTLHDGSSVSVPMMSQTGEFGSLTGDGWSALRLPYGADERAAMYIFLPATGRSLADFYAQLDAEAWERWMESFRSSRLAVSMPRFGMEYSHELTPALRALGMRTAFDPAQADFSGMLPRDFLDVNNAYVSRVEHKTFVEVNEEGTEAAGATGVGIGIVSMPPQFTVDRPFFVAIRDEDSGAVLFTGQVTDPR